MQNMLLEKVEYQIEETPRGTWRRFAYPTGGLFAEFRSHRQLWGLPVLHYTRGICPETGRRIVARGVVGVGRLATGVIAVGHASFGVIAIGQLAVGLIFGLGQAATGAVALGQLAIALLFGAGQIATGAVAIAQIALGNGPRPVRPRPPRLEPRPRRPRGRRLLQGVGHETPGTLIRPRQTSVNAGSQETRKTTPLKHFLLVSWLPAFHIPSG
jgi:hypothetical protein